MKVVAFFAKNIWKFCIYLTGNKIFHHMRLLVPLLLLLGTSAVPVTAQLTGGGAPLLELSYDQETSTSFRLPLGTKPDELTEEQRYVLRSHYESTSEYTRVSANYDYESNTVYKSHGNTYESWQVLPGRHHIFNNVATLIDTNEVVLDVRTIETVQEARDAAQHLVNYYLNAASQFTLPTPQQIAEFAHAGISVQIISTDQYQISYQGVTSTVNLTDLSITTRMPIPVNEETFTEGITYTVYEYIGGIPVPVYEQETSMSTVNETTCVEKVVRKLMTNYQLVLNAGNGQIRTAPATVAEPAPACYEVRYDWNHQLLKISSTCADAGPVKRQVRLLGLGGQVFSQWTSTDGQEFNVDVSGLTPGLYIVSVLDGKHAFSTKIIVN